MRWLFIVVLVTLLFSVACSTATEEPSVELTPLPDLTESLPGRDDKSAAPFSDRELFETSLRLSLRSSLTDMQIICESWNAATKPLQDQMIGQLEAAYLSGNDAVTDFYPGIARDILNEEC